MRKKQKFHEKQPAQSRQIRPIPKNNFLNPTASISKLSLLPAIGNQACQRLLKSGRLPARLLQSSSTLNKERDFAGLESQIQSGGRSLSQPIRRFFEPRFGRDFSRVKIHADSGAAKSAETISAKAFTINPHIWFGQGQYAPETPEGKKLIAHELTHVIQQETAGNDTVQRDHKDSPVVGPCPNIQVPHVMLRDGAIHPGVREAQHKLNLFDEKSKAAGNKGLPNAFLVEDCVFGPKTHEAVLAFQQQFFPLSPAEWDGIIGPKTWAGLDMTASAPAPTPVCPIEAPTASTSAPTPSMPGADYPALSGYAPCGPQPEVPTWPGAVIDEDAHHCRLPIDMIKIIKDPFQGGYRMEDYYPEKVGQGQWQHGDTAGPWIVTGPANCCRAGVNVQLIGTIPGHCDSHKFQLEQYVTYTLNREGGKPKATNECAEGTTKLDTAKYDFSRAPKRQTWVSFLPDGYSIINISMADPPSSPYYGREGRIVATPTKQLHTLWNFESSLVGPNGKKTVHWSHELIVENGMVMKNKVL